MNIVIIEDEPLTAEDLADTLQQVHTSVQIQAILPSIKRAVEYFKEHDAPDLIFSDIQLGDGLSFEIFKAVSIPSPVVFCTAYDVYALDAFKSNGIDYILKPFSADSIRQTLRKYEQLQANLSKKEVAYGELMQLLGRGNKLKQTTILVYQRDKILPIPINKIAIAFVDHQSSFVLCFDQQKYAVNYTLDELERMFGDDFFRASRQHLIHHQAVKEVSQYFGRKLAVALTFPFKEDVLVSRARSTSFLEWLGHV